VNCCSVLASHLRPWYRQTSCWRLLVYSNLLLL
jgi:hypothetical protein